MAKIILVVALAVAFYASAVRAEIQEPYKRICIFAAAAKLPPIPGMTVGMATVGVNPKHIGTMLVAIPIKIAGADMVADYDCNLTSGSANITPLGIE